MDVARQGDLGVNNARRVFDAHAEIRGQRQPAELILHEIKLAAGLLDLRLRFVIAGTRALGGGELRRGLFVLLREFLVFGGDLRREAARGLVELHIERRLVVATAIAGARRESAE